MNTKTMLNIGAAAALLVAGTLTTRVSSANPCACDFTSTHYNCNQHAWGAACYPVPNDPNSFVVGFTSSGQPEVGAYLQNTSFKCAWVQDDSNLGCSLVDTTQGTSQSTTQNCVGASTYTGSITALYQTCQ
jgi:hypothetical protein